MQLIRLMLSKFYLIICLLFVFGCSDRKPQFNPDHLIAHNLYTYDPTEVKAVLDQQRVTNEELMSTIASLKTSFRSSYAGYYLKKSLIGISGDEVFENCQSMGRMSPQYLASYEYYDIILKCLAQFKDGHLDFENVFKNPSRIVSPVASAYLYNGRLYIREVRTNLITKLEEKNIKLNSIIAPGHEIISINGKSPLKYINEVEEFVSASSPLARQSRAITQLFNRDFYYPSEPKLTLKIKLNDLEVVTVEIPWVIEVLENDSLESKYNLSLNGFSKDVDLSSDENLMKRFGLSTTNSLFTKQQKVRLFKKDNSAETALQLSNLQINNENICYIKLNTFSIGYDKILKFYKLNEILTTVSSPASVVKVIAEFLVSCEVSQHKVIFDLTSNSGGNPLLAEQIFALFNNKENSYSYRAESMLQSAGNSSFLNSYYFDNLDKPEASLTQKTMFTLLADASINNKKMTDWLVMRSTNLRSPVYTKQLFILASERCMSACDSIVRRFKNSQRGKVIGSPVAGTGFGFYTDTKGEVLHRTSYRDPLNLFELRIPNYALQNVQVSDESLFMVDGFIKLTTRAFESIPIAENNPIQPDYFLEQSNVDLTTENSEYIKKLADIIKTVTAQ